MQPLLWTLSVIPKSVVIQTISSVQHCTYLLLPPTNQHSRAITRRQPTCRSFDVDQYHIDTLLRTTMSFDVDQYHIDSAKLWSVYLSVNASQFAIRCLPIRGLVISELALVYQPSQTTLNDLSVAAGETALTEFEGFYHIHVFPRAERSHMGLIIQPCAG